MSVSCSVCSRNTVSFEKMGDIHGGKEFLTK